MQITVLVLNYNGIEDTRGCLKSLLKTDYDNFKVIVLDNGSSENEAKILEEEFSDKRLRFMRFDENYGYAKGYNIAILKINTKYVVLLNNDTVVSKNWLKELVRCVEKDEKIAGVQSKLMSYNKRGYFDPSAAGGYLDKLGYPYTRGRIGVHIEKDEGQYDEEADIFWGAGAALLLRCSALKKSGLLAEDFYAYHEEVDLCWRMKNLGYRIVSCPKSVVFHKGEGWWRKHKSRKMYFIHRNNLWLITRNLSWKKLLLVLPLRLILDALTGFLYLYHGNFHQAIAMVLGDLDFLIRLPVILLGRLQKKGNCLAEKDMNPFCIYFDYYVRKRRRFSEIFGKDSKTEVVSYDEVLGVKEKS